MQKRLGCPQMRAISSAMGSGQITVTCLKKRVADVGAALVRRSCETLGNVFAAYSEGAFKDVCVKKQKGNRYGIVLKAWRRDSGVMFEVWMM